MNTKKQRKAGFTLVELMVVAIIVAILAAVAIPLMSGNKERAIATEAQAAMGTIATAIRLSVVDDVGDTVTADTAINDLPGINAGDFLGAYYNHGDYSLTSYTDYNSYSVTAAANGSKKGVYVLMTVANGVVSWSYDEPVD